MIKLIDDKNVDEIGLNASAIHAIGTLAGLSTRPGFPAEQMNAVLVRIEASLGRRGAHGAAKLAANRGIGEHSRRIWIASRFRFTSPPGSASGVSTMPAVDKAADALVKLSTDADYVFDGVVRDGVTCAAAKNDQRFLELLAKSTYPGKLAVDSDILLGRVAEHYARGIPTDHIGRLLVMLSEGSPVLSAQVVAGLSRLAEG